MKTGLRILGICLLVLCTACAHTDKNTGMSGDAGESHRIRNTLLAVGAAVIVGVIAANQAESSIRDALRVPPMN